MRAEDDDLPHVRYTPDSGHSSARSGCPLGAISGHSVVSGGALGREEQLYVGRWASYLRASRQRTGNISGYFDPVDLRFCPDMPANREPRTIIESIAHLLGECLGHVLVLN